MIMEKPLICSKISIENTVFFIEPSGPLQLSDFVSRLPHVKNVSGDIVLITELTYCMIGCSDSYQKYFHQVA